MNGGHFEHKFWASDFLLCFVVSSILVALNLIDINMCKVLILCKMCYFCVCETFTRYGSNIANVWQEIFTPMTLAFSCEVVHAKLWKSINNCKKVTAKKSVAPFFLDTVYTHHYFMALAALRQHYSWGSGTHWIMQISLLGSNLPYLLALWCWFLFSSCQNQ